MRSIGILFSFFMLMTFTVSASVHRKNDNDLSLELAKQRKSQVKNVAYNLYFELSKGATGYKGRTEIKFDLNRVDQAVSIDFLADKIVSITVNQKPLKKYISRRGSFDLPKSVLVPHMTVEVVYVNSYSKESGGFLRSIDPEDKSEYMYTDFEPYYAHHLFPCFDQPDLKATYQVKVLAPKDWKVIQNELAETEEVTGDNKLTSFKTTPLISTYLFFLGAGPFVEWKDKSGDVPLYIYARKSLEKYVDADKLFKTTKRGLKFFTQYFKYPYPFSKYGQVFVPEFAWGGMENPGAVTLNERNIFRGPVPASRYEKRDNLILHEMAHMWFGDLVTMEWWNDLWLNESFATYLATIAQERAMDSDSTWTDFFQTKTWGYWQDQLITTHAIETEVPDVRTARGNFDGITYAKGASALKQLHFYVGEEGFREGLRAYFKKYAFQNTQRKDFIGSIGEAAKKNLDGWTKNWLQTAGMNRVNVNVTCDQDKINFAQIIQKPSVSKTLSPHRARIGLYRKDDDELELMTTVEVVYDTEQTEITGMLGKKCPDFILPNKDDQDYALFSLDKKSLEQSKLALTTLENSLDKSMVWTILSQMVRDQELSPVGYIELAMAGLAVEKDDLLLGNLLGRHSTIRNQYQLYLTSQEREGVAPKFEEVIWNRVTTAKPGSSLQMIFFDFYLSMAQTPESQNKLFEMLTKNAPPKGITLDQDRRWVLITNLSSNGHKGSGKLIAEEMLKDASTMGKRMAFGARAAMPDLNVKKEMWKNFFAMKDLSYSNFKEAASQIHGHNSEKMSQPFVSDFFKHVSRIDWKKHDDVVDIYFEELYPTQLCSPELLKMSQNRLKNANNLTSLAKRSWLEAQDELNRCVKVRNYQKDFALKF